MPASGPRSDISFEIVSVGVRKKVLTHDLRFVAVRHHYLRLRHSRAARACASGTTAGTQPSIRIATVVAAPFLVLHPMREEQRTLDSGSERQRDADTLPSCFPSN